MSTTVAPSTNPSTLRDIARLAGVSVATVSRVLNNHPHVRADVRDRVMGIVNRARYSTSAQYSDIVNLAFVPIGGPSFASLLHSPFDTAVLEGMSAGMPQMHYNLTLLDAHSEKRPDETYSQMFHRRGIRGVVVRTLTQSRAVCESIAEEGFPMVVVGEYFSHPGVSFVRSDSKSAARQAIDHLLGLGHRRIGVLTYNAADADHTDRLNAYMEAHEARGVEVDHSIILRGLASRGAAADMLRQLTARMDPPTAIFACDPPLAIGAFLEALRLGLRIPQDISIIGVDDTDMRLLMTPTMAAVCQDSRRLGVEACKALMRLVSDAKAQPVQLTLDTWLEVHPSVGAPKS